MKYELELQSIVIGDTTIKLFVPMADSVKQVYQAQREADSTIPFPYWARVWPAALALSTFLQKEPHYIIGKTVLELAAGVGLPSLLAARYASTVCCSDYLPETLDVVQRSIALNGAANISTRLLDWHRLPADLTPEVLLLSDINYDPREFDVLYGVFTRFLHSGTLMLLSTPQRLMAKPFIERLLPWCIHQEELPVLNSGEVTPVSVLVLISNPA